MITEEHLLKIERNTRRIVETIRTVVECLSNSERRAEQRHLEVMRTLRESSLLPPAAPNGQPQRREPTGTIVVADEDNWDDAEPSLVVINLGRLQIKNRHFVGLWKWAKPAVLALVAYLIGRYFPQWKQWVSK